jgi:CysZ protein
VAAGVGVLRHGFAFVLQRPRLMVLGAVPPFIMSVLSVLVLVYVALHSHDVAVWATPFAEGWDTGWRDPLRATFGVILVAATVLVLVMVFTALTLLLGAPIYDRISEAVEAASGGVPGRVDDPARVWVPRMIGQTAITLVQAVALGLALFVIGLIPGVGGVVSAILGALVGGFLVTRELAAGPAERRGVVRLADRRRLLGREPLFTLGFGIPVYVLLSIPFVAVAVFPPAAAGATMLTRRILGQRVA